MKLPDDHEDDFGSIDNEPAEAEAADNAPSAPAEAERQPQFFYRDAEHWLQELALPHYLRKLGGAGHRWAPNWYDYPEADTLIQLLWEFWEHSRLEGVQATLNYFRDYFYPLMNVLTSEDGPFHAYDRVMHPELPEPFPVYNAPCNHFPRTT
ncbi:DUF4913 domain-containing protein [Glutamicibacter creatinolyticus]|uniref:DUF4913 domain-containing protein n=1 Tax=Glutamicibacter creatinolyticus TaxID=162496 RepID=UPI0033DAB4A1